MADFEDALAWWLIDGGADGSGVLRAVIDDDSSNLTIAAGDAQENESHSIYNYTYETFEVSEEIKIQTASGSVTTTTTKKFSAKLISKLYNSAGELIMRADFNSKGKASGYYDKDNSEIFLENFELNICENIGIYGADAPAIAWCMAKNSERNNSLTEQKKAYKSGCKDTDETAKEVIELDEDIPGGSVDYTADLDSTLFDENSDGVYLQFFNAATDETSYIHIYNDGKAKIRSNGSGFLYGYGNIRVEAIGSGITVESDHPWMWGEWSESVFKSTYQGATETINGVRIVTGSVYVSTKGWGWSYENPNFHFPWLEIADGFRCVKITTSLPDV